MKKILLSLLLVFFTGSLCRGQSSIIPVFGIQKQLTIKRVTARAFVIPAAGIQRGKNIILIGPVIHVAQLDNIMPRMPLLTGVQITQAYFFTKQENRKLQFYGAFNSKYQEIEEEWVSNYWSATQNQYIDYEVETEETIWENSLGAGFVWNFHRNLNLNSSLGLGYYVSFSGLDDLDELSYLSKSKDYRGYRNKGLFYCFQLGIVYKFADVSKYLRSL